MKTMRVARLYGIGDMRVQSETLPTAGAGESLIRVTAVGICGFDTHRFPLEQAGDAFRAAQRREGIKVIVRC